MKCIPRSSNTGQHMVELSHFTHNGYDRHVFQGYMSAVRFADHWRGQGYDATIWQGIAGGWKRTSAGTK